VNWIVLAQDHGIHIGSVTRESLVLTVSNYKIVAVERNGYYLRRKLKMPLSDKIHNMQ